MYNMHPPLISPCQSRVQRRGTEDQPAKVLSLPFTSYSLAISTIDKILFRAKLTPISLRSLVRSSLSCFLRLLERKFDEAKESKVLVLANKPNSEVEPLIAVTRDNFQHEAKAKESKTTCVFLVADLVLESDPEEVLTFIFHFSPFLTFHFVDGSVAGLFV